MTNCIDWTQVKTIFLDMDGTLMDLAFDNYFWHEYLPRVYANKNQLNYEQTVNQLKSMYLEQKGGLKWYCTDYWSERLGVNIAEHKRVVWHRIQLFPDVVNFLKLMRISGKRVVLLTNAHRNILNVKMEKTKIDGHFDRLISSHDYGYAKEQDEFWPKLAMDENYNKHHTLFIDDNVDVLRAAQRHGLKYLLCVDRPDTSMQNQDTQDFKSMDNFANLITSFRQHHQ